MTNAGESVPNAYLMRESVLMKIVQKLVLTSSLFGEKSLLIFFFVIGKHMCHTGTQAHTLKNDNNDVTGGLCDVFHVCADRPAEAGAVKKGV